MVAASVEGKVLAIDRAAGRLDLLVQPAQQVEAGIQIGRGDALVWQVDDRIRGELVVVGGQRRLQRIFPDDPVGRGTISMLASRLRRDTLQRGSKVFRAVGEPLPQFALWDQHGKLFLSESLKGRYAVINFIFTRCPDATMCPAATERMRELRALAAERGVDDLQLVTITLDPEYDTPGIFRAYAADNALDNARHSLLGGPVGVVEDLKAQLGILAEPHPVQIIRHTLSTALVDPTGKIIYRIPGSMWDPDTFLRQIDKHRRSAHQ
jgi:protein SCO1